MTPFVQAVTTFLSSGIVLMNIISLGLIVVLLAHLIGSTSSTIKRVFSFVSRHGLFISFIIAFGATAASLFYSIVAGFLPCELCWWQRMFLFPQTLIFAIAWYRSWMHRVFDGAVFLYSLGLSAIGGAIALFHYYGSMFNTNLLAACEVGGISCAKQYFLSFGYINIPFMSLSTFLLLGVIALIRTLHK
jgi:disulfide bond formation protein DsbB